MIKLPNTGFKAFVNFSNKLVFSKLKKKKPRSCKVTIIPGENPNCTCKFYSDCGLPCVHMLIEGQNNKIDWCPWIHQCYFPIKLDQCLENIIKKNIIKINTFNYVIIFK